MDCCSNRDKASSPSDAVNISSLCPLKAAFNPSRIEGSSSTIKIFDILHSPDYFNFNNLNLFKA
ncbi:MAG: hypothetical protein ACD_79C00767G0002 [uncultured bacterium]|nr:MAG: hypothetical protein ACD_79C00767G0002 [uncultured bacterium]